MKRPGSWESSATVLALPSKALGPLESTCCFLSHVQLFASPWTGAPQAPLVHGISQARLLELVTISFSKAYFFFFNLESCLSWDKKVEQSQVSLMSR